VSKRGPATRTVAEPVTAEVAGYGGRYRCAHSANPARIQVFVLVDDLYESAWGKGAMIAPGRIPGYEYE
jgi:hypothetical protein